MSGIALAVAAILAIALGGPALCAVMDSKRREAAALAAFEEWRREREQGNPSDV